MTVCIETELNRVRKPFKMFNLARECNIRGYTSLAKSIEAHIKWLAGL
jgi:hypothetical protein